MTELNIWLIARYENLPSGYILAGEVFFFAVIYITIVFSLMIKLADTIWLIDAYIKLN